MIIVSQDKNRIINFDNILQLYITREPAAIKKYWIRYEDCNNFYEDVGIYETEERAKEVLQEIVKNNAMFKYFKYVNAEVQETMARSFIRADFIFDVYKMPER